MDKPTVAAGAAQKIEKQARQLAYDTRYKVKQTMKTTSGSRLDPASVTKAYLAQLAKSSASPAVKTRAKQMLTGNVKEEVINSVDTKGLASDSVANALYTVFVEGIENKEENIQDPYLLQLEELQDKKYKVRVTDKNTGNSYVRMATRTKIAELRANSNIASVEMTEYGDVSKSERASGSSTAKAKAGKGLDPVGQEDSDVNNDGKVDKTDKYLKHRRDVRGSAISTRKEELEITEEKEKTNQNERKIKEMKPGEKNKVTLFPDSKVQEETGYSKFLGMLNEKTLTAPETAKKEEIAKALKPKYGKTSKTYAIATAVAKKVAEEAECGMDEKPKLKKSEGAVDDSRAIPTKLNLVKNKLRAMGLKMSYEPEGEVLEQHRPPAGWKPYGGGPEDKPTVNIPLRGVFQAGPDGKVPAEDKPVRQASKPKGENKTA